MSGPQTNVAATAETGTPYHNNLRMLTDSANDTATRYQATLQIINDIDDKSIAKLAAQDLKSFINIIKDPKETTLHKTVLEIVWKLAQMKELKEEFTAGKLPEFCLDLLKDDRFRTRAAAMLGFLFINEEMLSELVNMGCVDVLLEYANSVEKGSNSEPHLALKTRYWVFKSLSAIAGNDDTTLKGMLLKKGVIESVKKNCFEINLAESYNSKYGPMVAQEIHKDEMVLKSLGFQIIEEVFHQTKLFLDEYEEVPREEAAKYAYPPESLSEDENEEIIMNPDQTPSLETGMKAFRRRNDSKKEQSDVEVIFNDTLAFLKDIQKFNIMDDVFTNIKPPSETAVFSMRIYFRASPMLHVFTSDKYRIDVVNKLLQIVVDVSGQPRMHSLLVLSILGRRVENCRIFVNTGAFNSLFHVGMQESGDVLKSLLNLLMVLSVHKSTAEEMSLRSDCPKLLVKILHEDFDTDIAHDNEEEVANVPVFQAAGTTEPTDEEKALVASNPMLRLFQQMGVNVTFKKVTIKPADRKEFKWSGQIPTISMMTLANLAMNSTSTRKAIIEAGAVPVLSKILNKHPDGFIGMSAVMALCYIHSTEKNNLIPECSNTLIEMIFNCLEYSMESKSFYGYVFTVEELTLALRGLSLSRLNGDKVIRGMPLYIKILKAFTGEYGTLLAEKVSKDAVTHIIYLLQALSTIKKVLALYVELGQGFVQVLESIKDSVIEKDVEALSINDQKLCAIIDSLLYALQDEYNLTTMRIQDGAKLRKSSAIELSKYMSQKEKAMDSLNEFVEQGRLKLDL